MKHPPHPAIFALLTLALALIATPSRAASPFAVTPIPAGARVTLNGRTVAVIRTPNRGLAPADRAALAIQRLERFLADGGRPIAIQPRPIDEGAGVYAGDTLTLVVTAAEAAAHHKTPQELADFWARNLRAALTLPPLDPTVGRSGVQATKGKEFPRPTAQASALKPLGPTPKARGPQPSHGSGGMGGRTPKAQGRTPKAPPAPALALSTRDLVVPVGETRTVSITASGPVTVELQDTETAEVTPGDGKAPSLRVRGVAPGQVAIRVLCGSASTTLAVAVLKYAGKIDPQVAVDVTGRPCPESVARDGALQAVREALSLEPGAVVTLGRATGPDASLEPEQVGSVRVPVTIKGEGYLPVERTVTVAVTNRALPSQEPRVLLYSNNPERVTGPASLFLGALESDVATRLLYHHQNMAGRPLSMRVDLVNAGEEPAEVQVIEGGAGPSWDTVMVGHRAAARYLRNQEQDTGTIVTLAPGARRTILAQRIADKLALSGLYGLRLLPRPRSTGEGREPSVRVEVAAEEVPAPAAESSMEREPVAELAQRPLSDHVYTSVRLEMQSRFSVGGGWAFIPVGKKAIQNQSESKRLDGNYGVLYDIALELENPTDEARTISISLSPDAGLAMGVSRIDGAIVESPQVSPPAEAALATFRLQPRERRTVPIQTIPVGGSNYPISLVVRTDPSRKAASR
jgi:hypothetical protein